MTERYDGGRIEDRRFLECLSLLGHDDDARSLSIAYIDDDQR